MYKIYLNKPCAKTNIGCAIRHRMLPRVKKLTHTHSVKCVIGTQVVMVFGVNEPLHEISLYSDFSFILHRATQSARHASSYLGRGGRACPATIAASCSGPSPVPRRLLELAIIQGRLPAQPDVFFRQSAQSLHQPGYHARWKRQFCTAESMA